MVPIPFNLPNFEGFTDSDDWCTKSPIILVLVHDKDSTVIVVYLTGDYSKRIRLISLFLQRRIIYLQIKWSVTFKYLVSKWKSYSWLCDNMYSVIYSMTHLVCILSLSIDKFHSSVCLWVSERTYVSMLLVLTKFHYSFVVLSLCLILCIVSSVYKVDSHISFLKYPFFIHYTWKFRSNPNRTPLSSFIVSVSFSPTFCWVHTLFSTVVNIVDCK